MAIADELTKLEANRANIVAAINSKGGELADNAGLAACPDAISQLGNAGGETTLWTGHVDEAGLRYIGWDDEDIANLKANICWNEEDDALYAVPQDHKDLWDACEKVVVEGRTMLNYSEIDKWLEPKFILKYLPYIDFSSVTNIANKFENKFALISLPNLDTSNVVNIQGAFKDCRMLICLPQFGDVGSLRQTFMNCNMLKNVNINSCKECDIADSGIEHIRMNPNAAAYKLANFRNCKKLKTIPGSIDASTLTDGAYKFENCGNLEEINLVFNNLINCNYMFNGCSSLKHYPNIKSKVKNANGMFINCTFAGGMPNYDFSECINAYSICSGVSASGDVRIDFPKVADIRNACYGIMCKRLYFKFYATNVNMGFIYGAAKANEIHFDSKSVLTGVTAVGNMPFNNTNNRINKGAVTYTLVKEVCDMLLRGIPNYSAASYPMYFESGSTVTDDAAGTLQSLVEQCQAMGWAIYNLTINPYSV